MNPAAETRFCDDCAWPEDCSARLECERRNRLEVRAAGVERVCIVDAPGAVSAAVALLCRRDPGAAP